MVAVEPSWRMIRQRATGTSRSVQAFAEALPFGPKTFDAALAVLTLHHWSDWRCGLAEMKRVAGRLVILTYDPQELSGFWLVNAYFPELVAFDRGRCPSVAQVAQYLGPCRTIGVVSPHDCVDGFLAAFWCRPEAYLDPGVRAGMSSFALLDQDAVARGIARLRSDLESLPPSDTQQDTEPTLTC